MGAQEEQAKRREFQRRTDEDIDKFLAREDVSRTSQTRASSAPRESSEPPTTRSQEPKQVEKKEAPTEIHEPDQEDQIRAARTSRAEREAYQDVAVLRKKAHAFGHKAAKMYHKYKANEAKAQKCSAKAVAYREKAAERKERAEGFREKARECQAELSGAAQGKTELSPESLRTKIAQMERKIAKQEEVAGRNESKAADQSARAAKFKTKAAKFLEQNKLFESESRLYAKRADNLEKAGV